MVLRHGPPQPVGQITTITDLTLHTERSAVLVRRNLCPRHHELHHQGRLGIAGDADEFDGLVFTDEHGVPIPGSGSPTPPTGPPPTPTVSHQPPLAGRFDWNWIGLGWVHPNAQQRRIERARQVAPPRRHAA